MSLAELIMDTPVRVFSGVRSRTYGWPSDSIWDKMKNGWSNFKYNFGRKKDRIIDFGRRSGLDKVAKYTGLSKLSNFLWHFYIEGIGVPGFGGIGVLPQRVQDVYEKKNHRPHGITTLNSLIMSVPDKAKELVVNSALISLGGVAGILGYAGMTFTGLSIAETAYRAGYRLITGNNIGTMSTRLGYETGAGIYKIFKGGNGNVVPSFRGYRQPLTPSRSYYLQPSRI